MRQRYIQRFALASWLLWLALLLPDVHVYAVTSSEYQLKAAFLFNFVQFVDWPANAFASSTDSLIIGVLGDDPFDGELDALVRNEHVDGRELQVKRYSRVEDVGPCHMLFISASASVSLHDILEKLHGRPILTVGDSEKFLDAGGMIRFVTQENHIRLQINLQAANDAQLRLSSKLLRRAQIVAASDG